MQAHVGKSLVSPADPSRAAHGRVRPDAPDGARVTPVTLKEMLAEVGPKTQDAFFDLLYKCNIRDLDFEFEQTLDLEVLAAETGPETMPAPHLLNIV